MSAYRRCPPTGGVRLQEVSISGGLTEFDSGLTKVAGN